MDIELYERASRIRSQLYEARQQLDWWEKILLSEKNKESHRDSHIRIQEKFNDSQTRPIPTDESTIQFFEYQVQKRKDRVVELEKEFEDL